MAQKFIHFPVSALDVNNLPTTLTGAVLDADTTIDGVTLDTAYRAFVLDSAAVSPSYTIATPDLTAPVPSAVSGTQTGETTATWSATSDEAGGTMFAAAWPAASTDPTAAQVIAGTGGSIVAASSDTTPTADANNGGSFTGLTASTEYQVGVVHRDAAGNDSTLVVSAGTFTTAAVAVLTAPTISAVGDGTATIDFAATRPAAPSAPTVTAVGDGTATLDFA